ncbi:MAG: hypothetical protein M1827_004475 [Pycnora praestabilis]|nr:MAG: hypothetical protein M1827_004475 [Pycnora praestabilis]
MAPTDHHPTSRANVPWRRSKGSPAWTSYRDSKDNTPNSSSSADRDYNADIGSLIEKLDKSMTVNKEQQEERKLVIEHDEEVSKKDVPFIPFILPRIQLEMNYVDPEFALQHAEQLPFSVDTLAWALQHSFSFTAINRYIESYSLDSITRVIGPTTVEGFPVIFFAVERNCPKTVRFLIELGCQPSAIGGHDIDLPVLAFAVLHAENDCLDTTDVVTTLLGLGAGPTDIPKDMWEDFLKVPQIVRIRRDDEEDEKEKDSDSTWGNPELRAALARTLNLTQRYFLAKSHQLKPPSSRAKQVAKAHKMTALLEAPYHLVGQAPATNMVLGRVFGHIALCSDTPLILLYAGPSGHGKTELAKQMGTLMSVETLVVDCTEMRYETDMFGPKHPYAGSTEGTPLNNYLAQKNGIRSIIFLDEFEKTTDNVRRALLLAFDSGYYRDRRNGKELDCTKTIWVLASNMAEDIIVKFYKRHMEDKTEEERAKAPFAKLDSMLKREFAEELGAPITGRISLLVPFFPFSPPEQAVVAHKFLLSFLSTLRQPIDLFNNPPRFIGHIHLHLQNDGKVSSHLAAIGYEEALGARSLARVVTKEVQTRLADAYVEGEERITEEVNGGALMRYGVALETVGGEEAEVKVVVRREGETVIWGTCGGSL